mgnify:CR=1 FL=1
MNRNLQQRLDRFTFFGFTILPVLLYGFFYVFSVISGIVYSFSDWNGIDRTFKLVGFKNYIWLLKNENFWMTMRTTVLYMVLLVTAVLSLSLMLSLALNALVRFKTLIKSIFFVPAMIGSVTIALIWDKLFYRVTPYIGQYLQNDLLSQSPLASPAIALFAVVLVHVWQAVAMPTIIFIASLQTIPDEQYESAMLDGASTFQRFRHITLPYLQPTITVNLVLLVKQGFTSFDYPFTLTGGGPVRATEVIGISIINDAFSNMKYAQANAEACILFVLVASISIFQIILTNRNGVNEA